MNSTLHIKWEFRPFYRRVGFGPIVATKGLVKYGWKDRAAIVARVLWATWPIRWVLIEEGPGVTSWDYYGTANDAAVEMARRYHERPPK